MRLFFPALVALAFAISLSVFRPTFAGDTAPAEPPKASPQTPITKVSVRCGICTSMVTDLEDLINQGQIDHPYHVLSRYRLDEKQRVPYSRSAEFLEQTLESYMTRRDPWSSFGVLRSAEPQRVMRRGSDPRLIYDHTRLLMRGAADLLEAHSEALLLILGKGPTRLETGKSFCVDLSKACSHWPVVWPTAEDQMPPTPPPATPAPPAAPAQPESGQRQGEEQKQDLEQKQDSEQTQGKETGQEQITLPKEISGGVAIADAESASPAANMQSQGGKQNGKETVEKSAEGKLQEKEEL